MREPVIDLAIVAGDLEVVIWRFGRDFEPSDEHRMRVRGLIDEVLDGDRLPDGLIYLTARRVCLWHLRSQMESGCSTKRKR